MRKRNRRELEEPSINLTPLIDVVFVVLIMFIVVAPLLEMDQIQLADAGPEPQVTRVDDRSPIQIQVKSDNTVWYNKQLVTLDVLEMRLREDRPRHPNAHPLLFQDRRAQFGLYQSIKNAAEAAGYDELEVLLNPA